MHQILILILVYIIFTSKSVSLFSGGSFARAEINVSARMKSIYLDHHCE